MYSLLGEGKLGRKKIWFFFLATAVFMMRWKREMREGEGWMDGWKEGWMVWRSLNEWCREEERIEEREWINKDTEFRNKREMGN